METPLYHYEPLQHSDSIRILVLHPSPNDADPIACTLRQIQLSDVPSSRYATSHDDYILECSRIFFKWFSEDIPKYEAVSYTWGDCTQTNTIYFNDGRQRLIVGKNCHAALRRLRLAHGDRTVWIDAVCIDQQDLRERGHQVRIMSEVYNRAEGVMVMLSDEVPDSRLLMDEVNYVIANWEIVAKEGRITPCEEATQQLRTLYKDPWFKRTWVLQEVHAKDCITIVYGSAIFPFPVLEGLHVGSGTSESQFPPPIWIACRSMTEYCTSQFNLWNRLYETRECLATNPRDKVFALKSLLGPRQSDIDYLIDYTQTVENCFTQVAGFLLPVLGLRMLAATRHPHNLNMASWIPDWSQHLPLNITKFSFESEEAMREGCFSMTATADDHERTQQSYSISDLRNDATMFVVGCQYARIVDCSKTFRFVDYDDAATQMRNVYNEFDNLRQYLDEESKHDTATVSGHFSTKTIESKPENHVRYYQR
jgi:hypothetical protein